MVRPPPPKGVNRRGYPLRIGFWRKTVAFLEIETSIFLQSSSFVYYFIWGHTKGLPHEKGLTITKFIYNKIPYK